VDAEQLLREASRFIAQHSKNRFVIILEIDEGVNYYIGGNTCCAIHAIRLCNSGIEMFVQSALGEAEVETEHSPQSTATH
jgi:hypothetical protein